MKYSQSTGCFYPDDIHYPSLPGDLIEADQADFDAAMNRTPGEMLDVENGKLIILPAPPPEPVYIPPKLVGVEFGGVMCSATAEDQNGLTAVLAT